MLTLPSTTNSEQLKMHNYVIDNAGIMVYIVCPVSLSMNCVCTFEPSSLMQVCKCTTVLEMNLEYKISSPLFSRLPSLSSGETIPRVEYTPQELDTWSVTSLTHVCTHILINPRRACAARVTVVVLSFCLSVCYHVFCRYEQQDGQ